MKQIPRLTAILVAGAVAAALSLTVGLPKATAASEKVVPVTLKEWSIELPADLLVQAGDTVRFQVQNQGAAVHAIAVSGHGVSASIPSPWLSAGNAGSLDVTFPEAGTYTLICPVAGHKEAGMKTTLTVAAKPVTAPAAQATPAPTPAAQATSTPAALPKTGDGSASRAAGDAGFRLLALLAAALGTTGLVIVRRAR